MKQYITKTGQNIFDISVLLYGDHNGLFDLLMSNQSLSVTDKGPQELVGQPLSFDTVLSKGVILNYHSDFVSNSDVVDAIRENKINIANGTGNMTVYQRSSQNVKMVINQHGKISRISFNVGTGTLSIDWGDGNNESFPYKANDYVAEHSYKDTGNHIIYISGTFGLRSMDLSEACGDHYIVDNFPTLKLDDSNGSVTNSLITIPQFPTSGGVIS